MSIPTMTHAPWQRSSRRSVRAAYSRSSTASAAPTASIAGSSFAPSPISTSGWERSSGGSARRQTSRIAKLTKRRCWTSTTRSNAGSRGFRIDRQALFSNIPQANCSHHRRVHTTSFTKRTRPRFDARQPLPCSQKTTATADLSGLSSRCQDSISYSMMIFPDHVLPSIILALLY